MLSLLYDSGARVQELADARVRDVRLEPPRTIRLTGQCNLCTKRLAAGKLPSCVQVCQANCLQLLDSDEAARIAAANPKMLMMTL